MDRRRFLSGVAVATTSGLASGCLGGRGAADDGPGTGEDGESPTDGPAGPGTGSSTGKSTDTPTGTDAPAGTPGAVPGLTDGTFRRTGDCTAAETGAASVSFGADAVTVTGCITGNDGCQRAALAKVTSADGGDSLTVVVTTEAAGETPQACTQALVYRAYEAVLTFDGELPDEVGVVHDSMGERRRVAHASRE